MGLCLTLHTPFSLTIRAMQHQFRSSDEAAFTSGLLLTFSCNLRQHLVQFWHQLGATQICALFSDNDFEQMLSGYLYGCKTNHVITVAFGAMVAAISLSNMKPVDVQETKEKDKKRLDW
jgi:hypothetical protein